MATKKQKRIAAAEKRARFEEELRRTGLEAQRKDREHQEANEFWAGQARKRKAG